MLDINPTRSLQRVPINEVQIWEVREIKIALDFVPVVVGHDSLKIANNCNFALWLRPVSKLQKLGDVIDDGAAVFCA